MKTLMILSILCGAILSAPANDLRKIGVKLNISGQTGLEGQFRSCIFREFQAIKDVEVTDVDALMEVDIIILEARNKAGQSIGHAISIAITDQMPVLRLAIDGAVEAKDPEKGGQIVQSMPKGGILVKHILQTLDSDSLPETCKQLAVQIDKSQLEAIRKASREALRKYGDYMELRQRMPR